MKIKVHPSSKIIIIPSIIYWPLFKGCCIFISILQYQSNWYVLNLRRSSLSITPSVDPPPHSQKPIPPQPSTPQPTALLVTPAPTQSPLQCNPYYKEAVIYLGTRQRKNPCNFEKKNYCIIQDFLSDSVRISSVSATWFEVSFITDRTRSDVALQTIDDQPLVVEFQSGSN